MLLYAYNDIKIFNFPYRNAIKILFRSAHIIGFDKISEAESKIRLKRNIFVQKFGGVRRLVSGNSAYDIKDV